MNLLLVFLFVFFGITLSASEVVSSGSGYKITYSVPIGCPEKSIKSTMSSLEAEVKKAGISLVKLGSSATATLTGSGSKVKNSWGNIDSYLYAYSTYTGGAHSNNSEISFNYPSDSCEELKLKDIVKISPETLKKLIIEKLKKKDFQANDSSLDPDFEKLVDVNELYFYFADEYFIVAFREYSIAPYSTGIVRVRFLKDEVNPKS